MKILRNYKTTGKMVEEFPIIKIMTDQEDVFVELPIIAVDFNKEYREPALFGNHNGLPTVIEKEELLEILKDTEIKYFDIEEDKLIPVTKEKYELKLRLPKGTNDTQLFMDNGQVVWAKPIEEE